MAFPVTKISLLRAALAAGDGIEALRIAARFPRLPAAHKRRITLGWEAHAHPRFYEGMGRDVAALVADGIAAVREAYGDQPPVQRPPSGGVRNRGWRDR